MADSQSVGNTVGNTTQRHIAAVDFGSNSFHMIIAGIDARGQVRVLDKPA